MTGGGCKGLGYTLACVGARRILRRTVCDDRKHNTRNTRSKAAQHSRSYLTIVLREQRIICIRSIATTDESFRTVQQALLL